VLLVMAEPIAHRSWSLEILGRWRVLDRSRILGRLSDPAMSGGAT
jgi:hypothetical protein